MIGILMLSKWHVHAAGYAAAVSKQPDARIACVWDDDEARGSAWAAELGVPYEPDLAKALARPDVDAVIVDAPTSDHERVILAAAGAGKHIFTEKVMASTVAACRRIEDAVRQANVTLCVSMPQLTSSLAALCKDAIGAGWLGDIHYMRYRMAHDGASRGWLPAYWYDTEKSCGGAMMDLGCHPMYMASYLLGKPRRVASIFGRTIGKPPGEDNAVSVVEFEGGAIAVLETSFISPYQADCFELLGTKGAIVQVDGKIRIRAEHHGDGWFYPATLPEPLPAAMRVWLDSIAKGTDYSMFAPDRGTALTELIEAAYASHAQGLVVEVE